MQGLLSFGVAFNKIFVDISGNRELSTLLPLLEKVERVFPESLQLFVVKNFKLASLLQRSSLLS